MYPICTISGIRDAEERWFAAHPGQDLMPVAAGRLAESALAMVAAVAGQARIVVAIGPGNNGGDGLFAAASLAGHGHRVQVWFTAQARHAGGEAAAARAGVGIVDAGRAMAALAEADLVIDAVLGIGGRPGLSGPVAEFAQACTTLGVPVLAVDLPSGLDADSCAAPGVSFRATRTITFGAAKLCHVGQPAAGRCGQLEVADIGLRIEPSGVQALEPCDVARHWPFPGPTSDKYSRGVVGVDAGSQAYPGAGVLAATGAVYAGAGMVRFVGAPASADVIRHRLPSVTHGQAKVQSWVAGPGWGDRQDARARLESLLAVGAPAVLDADALRSLPERLPGCLLTPHAGELARLLGVDRTLVEADPIGAVRSAAGSVHASVLLKGATQYAAAPDGSVLIAVPGPAWTAQGGSGDVLAGICGTLLAAGLPAQLAGAVGASLQAMTAASRPGPYPPEVVATLMPEVLGGLERLRP